MPPPRYFMSYVSLSKQQRCDPTEPPPTIPMNLTAVKMTGSIWPWGLATRGKQTRQTFPAGYTIPGSRSNIQLCPKQRGSIRPKSRLEHLFRQGRLVQSRGLYFPYPTIWGRLGTLPTSRTLVAVASTLFRAFDRQIVGDNHCDRRELPRSKKLAVPQDGFRR
jgi:hypothetical protein